MLLSRFWYIVLALCMGAALFVLFLSQRLYNRHTHEAMAEALSADSSAVGWYLRDDARRRASALIPVALDPDLRKALSKASGQDEVEREVQDDASAALKKLNEKVPEDLAFTALWAVDAQGRVIANVGYETPHQWELGGFSVVADALHGWIRDDAWVWKERIYRVVARPVQQDVSAPPVGAVIGARAVDPSYASAVSRRTGAAIGFYVQGAMVAKHAPEGFDAANLDYVAKDIKNLETNTDYRDLGRSEVRKLTDDFGVVYARMPGEAWDLDAGYAVGRLATTVESPLEFLDIADESDHESVPAVYIGLVVFAVALLGLLFSIFEHTIPLRSFHREIIRMAKGEIDVLSPSRFRGLYKKIASDLNDGVEKVAAKGGAPRRAADLEEVLGPIPAQPAMSAFAVPGGEEGAEGPPPERTSRPRTSSSGGRVPPSSGGRVPPSGSDGGAVADSQKKFPEPRIRRPPPKPQPRGGPPSDPGAQAPPPPSGPISAPPPSAAASAPAFAPAGELSELEEWQRVYEEFLNTKKQCGENTSSLTFEKFKGTLERNKKALVDRHNCSRVRFTVYVKDGKAALKASPVK